MPADETAPEQAAAPGDATPGDAAPADRVTVFDETVARGVLAAAVRATGLTEGPAPAWPALLRLGSNAVFAVNPDVVARVSPAGVDADTVRRCLAVTAWLARQDFPAVRAVPENALDAAQPVTIGRHLVTFWWALELGGTGSTADLGTLLRRLHALPTPPELGAPPMDPVGRARRQLPLAPLPDGDRGFLLDRLDRVADRYEGLVFPLGEGLLHGDATTANVIPDRDGTATLIDFDLVRTGPREWDLLRTATYYRRLGWHTAAEYRAFCAGYGVDVTDWPGFEVMADLSELLQVGWLAEAAARRPALAPELRTRLATLRTGGSRRHWRAI